MVLSKLAGNVARVPAVLEFKRSIPRTKRRGNVSGVYTCTYIHFYT